MQYMKLCEDMLKLAGGGDVGRPLQDVMLTQWISTSLPNAAVATANCLMATHLMCRKRLNERHFIVTNGDPDCCRNCILCLHKQSGKTGQMRVNHLCSQCCLFMHIDCFEMWHTMLNPVSPRFTTANVFKKVFLK